MRLHVRNLVQHKKFRRHYTGYVNLGICGNISTGTEDELSPHE